MRKGRAVATLAALTFVLVPPAAGSADEHTVTRFATTDVFVNVCRNDEIVIVNATQVHSSRMTQTRTGLRYESRTWLENVSAASNDGAMRYSVSQGSIDAFKTTVRPGVETITSLQGSTLRLRPASGRRGELRVVRVEALQTNLSTGETRVLYTRDKSSCS